MSPLSFIPAVLEQHVDELTSVWSVRDGLCHAPHIRLRDLARFDERIAAHTDGCVLAGQEASALLTANLADVSPSRVFAAAVVAFELSDAPAIARYVALAESAADAERGLTSALGWVSATRLKGIVRDLLSGQSALQRSLGLAACRLHGVDPGPVLAESVKDSDAGLCAAAMRTAASLGLRDFASMLAAEETNDECRFWFAWARVLLGDRDRAVHSLLQTATTPGAHRPRALGLALQSMNSTAAHSLLRDFASDPSEVRWLLYGSGIAGDPGYVPWLIGQMRDDKSAKLAGEAFTLITGVDLATKHLDRRQPEGVESGPTDNPQDESVDMDPDEALPWPDAQKIEKWWAANGTRFQKGRRYFMGAPITREHCIDVLKNGHQRQRILAAYYLCLLNPGTPLFNTSAPAWRQQRLLARL